MKRIKASYKGTIIINMDVLHDEKRMNPIEEIRRLFEEELTSALQEVANEEIGDSELGTVTVTKEACSFEVVEE